ncbi:MAG: DUF480 domain-containing protein [Acidimicrobiales bacterium]|nr:DUF480 domain-containing protein [Acidimicrobiales bacterium]
MLLDAVEGRLVGSLIEKQLTTPQQYPLSLNSLTLACNQASNRDPVVAFAEADVEAALAGLKQKGLVRFVLPSHGRSVVRYRHVLDETLALDARQLALVAVLLLRGPQTSGELRARTERMAKFDGVDEVESDLEGLTRWQDPVVARLARRPGQKEERWAQLLAGQAPTEAAEPTGAAQPTGAAEPTGAGEAAYDRPATSEAVTAERRDLNAELDKLRGEVAQLREEVLALRLELEEWQS